MRSFDIKHPIEKFIENNSGAKHPVPLQKTSYDIEIVSGLAVIRSTRVFKNVEDRPIEATMTFPVPFDAAVYEIVAKVDGRVLTGKAQAAVKARETYEAAIDNGKRAVLHEELLRGLHMLSVGNVAPGVEIEVTASYVVPVSLSKGNGAFRIPLTVGQIYGQTPLDESDDLVTGGENYQVDVVVRSDRGTIKLNGKEVKKGQVKVQSNAPIEVQVKGLYEGSPSDLSGFLPSGKAVTIGFSPASKAAKELKMHILLDMSGSMQDRVSTSIKGKKSKWECILDGLDEASLKGLKASDYVTVTTFASHATVHGGTRGDNLGSYVRNLPFVSGGTDLPLGVSTVVNHEPEANVLLITDGKSWNKIDVQAAIATGARFTVVLVGDDALEINVGYLAAMTGGQMFVVRGGGVRKAISAAVKSMRNVSSPIVPIKGEPVHLSRQIGGVEINVDWKTTKLPEDVASEAVSQAVGAFAASLAVQAMEEEFGAVYAAEAGLVTHLTSIVLVDEEAEAVEGIPATRKVALSTPATALRGMSSANAQSLNIVASGAGPSFMSQSLMANPVMASQGSGHSAPVCMGGGYVLGDNDRTAVKPWKSTQIPVPQPGLPVIPSQPKEINDYNIDLNDYAKKLLGLDSALLFPTGHKEKAFEPIAAANQVLQSINWEDAPDLLLKGDISRLSTATKLQMVSLSQVDEIKKLAKSLKVLEVVALVAVLANQAKNRTAARIARAVLVDVKLKKLQAANKALGF